MGGKHHSVLIFCLGRDGETIALQMLLDSHPQLTWPVVGVIAVVSSNINSSPLIWVYSSYIIVKLCTHGKMVCRAYNITYI